MWGSGTPAIATCSSYRQPWHQDIRVVSAPTLGTARQRRPGSAATLLPHLRSLAEPRALESLPESPVLLKQGFCPSWGPAPSLTEGIWGDSPVVTGVSPCPLHLQFLGAPGGCSLLLRVPLPLPQNSSRPAGPYRAERWAAPPLPRSFHNRCSRLFTRTSHLKGCSGRRRNPRASCISHQPLHEGEGRGVCPQIH